MTNSDSLRCHSFNSESVIRVDLGLQKLPSIDPFEQLDPMMNDTEDVVEANRLRMIAIACLTSEELSLIGAHKVFGDESEDENDEEWVAPYEERNAFTLFDEA